MQLKLERLKIALFFTIAPESFPVERGKVGGVESASNVAG
jgi:hypothetical protein